MRFVVYDFLGLYGAARVWWTLRAYGVEEVRILRGGLTKWIAEGRPLEHGEAHPKPRPFTPRLDESFVASLDDVRAAMARGTVEVAAFDRDNVRLLSSGTLATMDNLIDQSTATYRLKAMFANDDEKLWPGEFVNARLLLEVRKDAVVIPAVAVQRGPQGQFAWVVKTDNTVEPRPIHTGVTTGDRTIILAGVHDGERVVTDGQYKLQTGASVTVVNPRAAKQGDQS
jgi:hypothetical protein